MQSRPRKISEIGTDRAFQDNCGELLALDTHKCANECCGYCVYSPGNRIMSVQEIRNERTVPIHEMIQRSLPRDLLMFFMNKQIRLMCAEIGNSTTCKWLCLKLHYSKITKLYTVRCFHIRMSYSSNTH